ncbi:helix-turn-helix transcriptional regulator [Streptomyces sp. NBC_01387]|uniref:helix-turn-helix domain-containing protein n=1 Tax=unclassified Streptomyces TaxID=2593676 RepID=UPI0024E18891|nr:helix-turn-helix transcriptional regulator [Streptomyces sp. A 4/2]WSV54408.1 helix-turn-helix transcriptional regulator [Streptomyces sp. NBC_01014]
MSEAWRYCGNQIKLWRTRAGVTRDQLGAEAGYSYDYVRSMEVGRRKPTLRLLEAADHLCEAGGLLCAAQQFLRPEKFAEYSQAYAEAEERATVVYWYEVALIPGLLQTEAYVRELIGNSCPPLDEETVDERVAARLERQQMLAGKPTVLFNFVIYEAALRAKVGGRELMKQQLHHLLELGKLRNVSVQVLPAELAAYPGLGGPLVLLETKEHERFAYVEGQETGVLYSAPDKVSALTQRHGMIRMQALSVEDSVRYIKKLAEEL